MSRSSVHIAAALLAAILAAPAHAQTGRANPGGYWEGKASTREVPMKDANKELTRSVELEMWFTVKWDLSTGTGTVAGEGQAVYDSVLKVENLPKATAAVPGGTVKFEPSVGGRLEGDNKRKFPIVRVIAVDAATGNGTMTLRKVNDPAAAAKPVPGAAPSWDAPMEFVMRADPGVSGTMSKGGVSVSGDSKGRVSGGVESKSGSKGAESKTGFGQGANTGLSAEVIVRKIPMTPFSPFAEVPGNVSRRAGGPFIASFEERTDTRVMKWSARQLAGEQREPTLTPEMRREIEEMIREQRARRR